MDCFYLAQGTDIRALCSPSEVEEQQDTAGGGRQDHVVEPLRNMDRRDDRLRVATARGVLYMRRSDDGWMRAPCFDACDCCDWTSGMIGTWGGDWAGYCRCGCPRRGCECGEQRVCRREWRGRRDLRGRSDGFCQPTLRCCAASRGVARTPLVRNRTRSFLVEKFTSHMIAQAELARHPIFGQHHSTANTEHEQWTTQAGTLNDAPKRSLFASPRTSLLLTLSLGARGISPYSSNR